ncbi:MAG: ABC transporter permease subunit, partial [Chthonomonadaceae bacterium]|nr:ABC transporter permease subunit [Chthonomonadaceae bacterium]
MADRLSDLSYHGYSGPTIGLRSRWLVIARASWRSVFKKKGFWVLTVFGSWYYLALISFLYVLEQMGAAQKATQITSQILDRMVWKDQFLSGLTYSQLVYMAIGLLVGAGAVANDNGSNALLVYLSKPCRKIDYLVGKWAGIFLPILVGVGLPVVFFYLYGLLNYRDYGFLSQDPWMGAKLAGWILTVAVFQSSVFLGVSSLFRQGRTAGAAFSAGYFLLSFFSFLMFAAWAVGSGGLRHRKGNPALVDTAERLYHLTYDGLQTGLAKNLLGTDGSAPFASGGNMPQMHAPPLQVIVVPIAVIACLALLVAWKKVKAVEVVK